MVSRSLTAVIAALVVALSGCSPDPQAIAKAKPATGATLVAFSQEITKKVDPVGDASLIQYFCGTVTRQACPPDILERLKTNGLTSESNRVDLAYAFTMMAYGAADGTSGNAMSDEDFLAVAYKTVLGRTPDQGGAKANLEFLKASGQRKTLLRAMLQSPEFRSR